MSFDYDNMTGILDFADRLVLEVDEDGDVIGCLRGEFPETSSGEPYHHGVVCLDQNGARIHVTTDMDFQSLVAEICDNEAYKRIFDSELSTNLIGE